MCGRYFLDNEDNNRRLLSILCEMERSDSQRASLAHRGEIYPSEIAPVIVAKAGGVTVLPMRWGFPRGNGQGLVINSRSEKADATPMFQKAVRERRCLVPMSGFYEWRRTPGGSKTKEKFAFTLSDAKEGELMYLAGVYGQFSGGFENGGFDGFAVLTQPADAQMSPYHHRMPVVLREEAVKKAWLFAPPVLPYAELRRRFNTPALAVSRV